jgi:hypothetical protein
MRLSKAPAALVERSYEADVARLGRALVRLDSKLGGLESRLTGIEAEPKVVRTRM